MIPYEPCQQLGQWFLPTGDLKLIKIVVAATCAPNKELMQTGAARYVDVDQAVRDGRKRRTQLQRRHSQMSRPWRSKSVVGVVNWRGRRAACGYFEPARMGSRLRALKAGVDGEPAAC